MKIYLFRHGQTHYNEKKIFSGWKDTKLTELGQKQARFLGRLLKDKKIDVAIHTSLSRSIDTLKIVLKNHKECKMTLIDDRMIERNYGLLNGQKHDYAIQEYGQKQYDLWHRGYNIRPPGGESFRDIEHRIKPFIKDLIRMIKQDKVNVAISAHGNSIRVFRKLFENATEDKASNWTIPYDKIYEYNV